MSLFGFVYGNGYEPAMQALAANEAARVQGDLARAQFDLYRQMKQITGITESELARPAGVVQIGQARATCEGCGAPLVRHEPHCSYCRRER